MILSSELQQFEASLSSLIPEAHGPDDVVYAAARHALFGGGKRLRPLLVLSCVRSLNGPIESALQPACALEMVHSYSLIHDDLPALDNDDVRRGRPTTHKAFGEANAILAGDYLLTRAFGVLASSPFLSAEQRCRLASILDLKAGGDGMIGGQVFDLLAENRNISLSQLKQIHSRKTGALMSAALLFGAVCCDDPREQLFDDLGTLLGLAFQIVDDVLDVTRSEEKKGRAVASDIANNKATYVSLLGLDEARTTAQQLLEQARQLLAQVAPGEHPLAELAQRLVHREL